VPYLYDYVNIFCISSLLEKMVEDTEINLYWQHRFNRNNYVTSQLDASWECQYFSQCSRQK